ncbi:MAG TPA: hypothetical protein PKZ32_08925 [Candidatus Melainabacteria bacterium]|nr:hypothetical protein [Candidatus Melainabacteria bacterium]
MIRSRNRSASCSRILAAISCGVVLSSPAFAQQGLSDWQSPTGASAPQADWGSAPPGGYLEKPATPAKKSGSSKKSAPPLRTDDFSSDFSSKGLGLSGWQTGSSGGSSTSGGQGLSGWQTGSSGGSSTSGGQGLSGWQTGSSGGSSSSGGQGLSGWQTGGSGGGATLGDVLQQEQSAGGTQLQGGVERDRTVNNTMGSGMVNDPNAMGGQLNGMAGGMANPMGGAGGLGGLGGALGGMGAMGGAGGLMDVLMNIMPKRQAPGTMGTSFGTNQSVFRTKTHTPNMLTGVPRTINRSVNRALNRNLNRGINAAASRATGSALRHLRF